MKASARLEVVRRVGRDVLVDARSEPPFAIRQAGDRILFVGSAAAPVGGDELEIDVVIGPGARATIGTVAATSIWPGPGGGRSLISTTVSVAAEGTLVWWPEPLVSIVGSDHRSSTRVSLDDGAQCTIIEEVSLGRSGQASGTLELEIRVERHGRPIVHHTERFGPVEPGAGSAVGVGAARHVISGVVVGPDAGDPITVVGGSERSGDPGSGDGARGAHGAWLPLATNAAMVLVVAPDRPAARQLLHRLRPGLQPTTALGEGSETGEAP